LNVFRGRRLRLFCFPPAGGSQQSFRAWQRHLAPEIEAHPVELPGHWARFKEPLADRLGPLAAQLAGELAVDRPFVLFGHSLGAWIAFEVVRALRRRPGALPLHLFVSARAAPQLPRWETPIHAMPEPRFRREAQRRTRIPALAAGDAELMALVLPVLRADFALAESYEHKPEAPLACPITAFGWRRDLGISRLELSAWRHQTSTRCAFHLLPGDHFTFEDDPRALLAKIGAELAA
jgi:surfactin synthase thioesterase subunit